MINRISAKLENSVEVGKLEIKRFDLVAFLLPRLADLFIKLGF